MSENLHRPKNSFDLSIKKVNSTVEIEAPSEGPVMRYLENDMERYQRHSDIDI